MFKNTAIAAAAIAAAATPSAALAATFGYNLRLVVPVQCSVNHNSADFGVASGSAYSLGSFREYCNSPKGYQLVVRYVPGSLKGARIVAGDDAVVLDGSGQTTLSRATGPRIRERPVFITPGDNGFDTGHLELDIIPS